MTCKRVRRQQRLELLAIHRPDTDRHRLSGVRLIDLDNQSVLDSRGRESRGERAQLRFVVDVQRYGVGAFGYGILNRLAGSVDELGGLRTERKVGANDAVVRLVGGGFSNASWSCTRRWCLGLRDGVELEYRRRAPKRKPRFLAEAFVEKGGEALR